jgi:hypothetical protein
MTRGKGYNIVLRRGVRGLAHYLLERDFDFLVRTVADKRKDPERVKEIIRDKEDLIEIMLDDPKLMAKIRETQEELLFISPYLLFSILLRQVRRQLRQRSFTVEISGRDRIPVFDARQAVLPARLPPSLGGSVRLPPRPGKGGGQFPSPA